MKAIFRLLMIAIFAGVGAGLGRVVVLVISFVDMPPLPVQLLIEGLGALFFASAMWDNLKHAPSPVRGVHGSARLAGSQELRQSLGGDRGLIVGRERAKPWSLLRYDGPAHLLTIAPTRSGKGAGTVIPNLLVGERSALVIDPKGENARVTARARARFGPVYVIDPFAVSGEPSAAFTHWPISILTAWIWPRTSPCWPTPWCRRPGQTGEAHWNEEAKALIAGVILHVICSEPMERRTLNRMRDCSPCSRCGSPSCLRPCPTAQAPAAWSPVPPAATSARPTARRRACSPPRSVTPTSSIAPAWLR